jgi:NAD(P)-dependent dehydrogenase (short-subunit alcohol dehydrogenase family)
MADLDFTGRVAIITGAGAGLGRQYALELGKRGPTAGWTRSRPWGDRPCPTMTTLPLSPAERA